MSISYRLYQTELRLAARERQVNDLNKRVDSQAENIAVYQSVHDGQTKRIKTLLDQNDTLVDRIDLDLDPRIARMIDTAEKCHAQYCETLDKVRDQRLKLADQLGKALDENKRLGIKIDKRDVKISDLEIGGRQARMRYIDRLAELTNVKFELKEKLDQAQDDNIELSQKLDNIHEEVIG